MPPEPPLPRDQRLGRLEADAFDVLVIGGGATGAATARDAALRGLRVALCEHGDFAGATSSASSKLIHGGLRYLQYLDLGLVFEGLRERRRLMETAPHLCRATEFVFPAYRGQHPTLTELGVGVALYHALALARPPSRHRTLSFTETLQAAPGLRSAGLQGAQAYIDCQTDDARLVLENILDAERAGALCLSYCTVDRLDRSPAGALRGAWAHDRLTGRRIRVAARVVVNATGPFSDSVHGDLTRGRAPAGQPRRRLRPTLGVHLVLDAARLPHRGRALVLRTASDGRLFFLLPHGPRTVVGTTDTDWRPPGPLRPGSAVPPPRPHDPIEARRRDVAYLLDALNHALPSAALHAGDVLATFAGLRPLIDAPAGSVSAVSREHHVYDEGNGVLTVAGGKLTTLRAMGEQITDLVVEVLRRRGFEGRVGPCATRSRRLPGAQPAATTTAPSAIAVLPLETRRHLEARYGTRAEAVARLACPGSPPDPVRAAPLCPDLPDLHAEIDFAVTREHAVLPADVLARRTHLAWQAPREAARLLPLVAERMAALLGLSRAEVDARAQLSEAELARFRAGLGATT